jgi:hypothetical protein
MNTQNCKTCRHWKEFDDAPCFGRCKKYGGGTSDWFGAKCEGYQAAMTADEILAELRKLSAAWKALADAERDEFYGEDAAYDRCIEELDELIERASAQ